MSNIIHLGNPRFKAIQTDGTPYSGGKLYTYEPGTTTNKAVYPSIADAIAETNALSNPVVLDSAGEATIVIKGAIKLKLDDSSDNNIWTEDNFNSSRVIAMGDADGAGEVRIYEDSDNGANYMGIKAPAAVTSNVTLTLPDGDGSSGQVLQTNGSGTLSWAASGAWTNVILGSNQNTTSATHSAVTGLAFTPAANTLYEIRLFVLTLASTTTNGTEVGVSWPTGVLSGGGKLSTPTTGSQDAEAYGTFASFNTNPGASPSSSLPYLTTGTFLMRTGASPSGDFQVTFATEDGVSTSTVAQYSTISYRVMS